MPALPPVPQVLRFTMKHKWVNDVDIVNRFFWSYSGSAPTVLQLDTLATNVSNEWGTQLMPHLRNDLVLTETTVEDLTSASAAVGVDTTLQAGSVASTELGAGTAFVLSFHVARRYRGGHPRAYISGIPASALTDPQTFTGGFTAAMTGAWTTLALYIASVPWAGGALLNQVNVSFFEGYHNVTFPSGRVRSVPTLRVAPIVDRIISVSANPKVASQRRRNLQSA